MMSAAGLATHPGNTPPPLLQHGGSTPFEGLAYGVGPPCERFLRGFIDSETRRSRRVLQPPDGDRPPWSGGSHHGISFLGGIS